eukprot:3264523-Rhodomonas_salina.1
MHAAEHEEERGCDVGTARHVTASLLSVLHVQVEGCCASTAHPVAALLCQYRTSRTREAISVLLIA